jgi:hypothetical protein
MTNSRAYKRSLGISKTAITKMQKICNKNVTLLAYGGRSFNSRQIIKEISMALVKITTLCSVIALSACATLNVTADSDVNYDKHNKTEKQSNGYGKFQFALIGDVPYGVLPGTEYPPFDRVIEEINDSNKIQWVMHAGDIKSGSTPCSDEMFYDRLQRYNQFDKPVVLTLGDNEWTDCHRVAAGEYQPLERLAKLREVFFSQPGQTIGGKTMSVETQASVAGFEEFPENVRWTNQHVVFAAIHIIGSQNGLKPFDPNSSAVRTQADDDEVARRTAAALAWLDSTFAKAEQINSPGVFIMIHANAGLEKGAADRTGFIEFLTALENHVQAYGKPVVLAHGDSHYFRVDKPALVNSGFLSNFTRVETFGSSHVHWQRVQVDPQSDAVFTVTQEIVPDNP